MSKYKHTPKNTVFPVTYVHYIYRRYAAKFKHKKRNPLFINNSIYSTLIRRFHEKMMDKIIYNQHEYKMPYHLGTILVVKKKNEIVYDENGKIDHKKSKMHLDFVLSKKYNKLMYHHNTHTKGYYMRFHWRKRNKAAYVKNIGIYSFIPSAPNKNNLKHAIRKYYTKGKIDFYNLDDDDKHRT
jgi:carboxylesterase type B